MIVKIITTPLQEILMSFSIENYTHKTLISCLFSKKLLGSYKVVGYHKSSHLTRPRMLTNSFYTYLFLVNINQMVSLSNTGNHFPQFWGWQSFFVQIIDREEKFYKNSKKNSWNIIIFQYSSNIILLVSNTLHNTVQMKRKNFHPSWTLNVGEGIKRWFSQGR